MLPGHQGTDMLRFRFFVLLLLLGSVGRASPTMMPLVGVMANTQDRCALPSPPLGITCSGGSISLGVLPEIIVGTDTTIEGNSGKVRYMVTPYAQESASSITWGPGGEISGAERITSASVRSTELGDWNIRKIVAAKGSLTNYPAAKYCDDLVFGGYSDWYLPSKSEMAFIYCKAVPQSGHNTSNPAEDPNCSLYGGKENILAGFSYNYWTSTEFSNNAAWIQSVSVGLQNNGYLKTDVSASNKVRCIRRY